MLKMWSVVLKVWYAAHTLKPPPKMAGGTVKTAACRYPRTLRCIPGASTLAQDQGRFNGKDEPLENETWAHPPRWTNKGVFRVLGDDEEENPRTNKSPKKIAKTSQHPPTINLDSHLKNHGVHFEHTHLCAHSGPVLARDRQAAGNNAGPHAQNVPRGS